METHAERVTLVYRIKIDIDNPSHELVPGMPGRLQRPSTALARRRAAMSARRPVDHRCERPDQALSRGHRRGWPELHGDRGEIFGLVGPDGAGKTTTMRMLAGVMRPDGGRIVIDGIDVVSDPEAGKQHLSYMPQRFGLYEDLTVDENIRFYADLFDVPGDVSRTAREQAAGGVGHDAVPRSAGRPALRRHEAEARPDLRAGPHAASAVARRADHRRRSRVAPRFLAHSLRLREEGVTILISTAYLDEAERCNRLALLHGGRVLYCDTPAALKARMPGALVAISSPAGRGVRAAIKRR